MSLRALNIAASAPRAGGFGDRTAADSRPHTVLVVDDHDIVRVGMEALLAGAFDLRFVAAAATLGEALALVGQLSPDLVITDMNLPDSAGLHTVRALVAAQEERHVLVVSMQDELLYAEQVLSIGARGYLMKNTAHAHLLGAARAVAQGNTWASQSVLSQMVDRNLPRRSGRVQAKESALTARELEVVEQLRAGKTTKQIGAALGISARTVDLYRSAIKRKLRLRTGAELVAYAHSRI